MSLKYRPEIDGLRAIAVMAVIVYHAHFMLDGRNILPGGFIGVDIFFVISGYLISSILLRAFGENSFSLKDFYIRRMRRILPILFTVMLVSLPFAWYYMMPQDVRDFAGSVLSSLTFVSNIWFWQEDSYWTAQAALKPFLHTWSLSVEEQFYIFYPFILLALLKYLPRHTTAIMGLGFIASLALAQYASLHHPVPNFYLLPTRGWELLGGALLAQMEYQRGGRESTPFLRIWMPKAAMAVIVVSLFAFTPQTPHPSLFTLAPVLASMTLIWFCQSGGNEIVTRLLGSRVFVGIGLLSYGLYIWHYPLFAFAQIIAPPPSMADKFIWIALSFLCATATYFLIEKPARDFNIVPTRTVVAALALALTVISSLTAYAYLHNGLWGRFPSWQVAYMGLDEKDAPPYATYVISEYDKHRTLRFADSEGKKRLLIMGDSFSQDLFNVMREGGFMDDMNVATHYIPARCQNVPASAPYQQHIAAADIHDCRDTLRVGDAALDPLIKSADIIIVTASWNAFTTSTLPVLYRDIKARTAAPVIIFGRKSFPGMSRQDILSLGNIEETYALKKPLSNESHFTDIALAEKLMGGSEAYIDFHRLICGPGRTCPVTTPDGHAISHDGAHLTRNGARFIAGLLQQDRHFMKRWSAALND